MRYLISIIDKEADTVEVVAQLNTPENVAKLRAFTLSLAGAAPAPSTAPGRKGNSVMVVGFDPDCELTGFEIGMRFSSSLAASRALGYKFDNVGPALRRAMDKGESTAILRGVEFQFESTVGNSD